METIEQKATERNLELYPHLSQTLKSIEETEELISLLNNRKKLINESSKNDLLSEYSANENKILIHKTNSELASLHKKVADRRVYVENLCKTLDEAEPQIEAHFNEVVIRAKNYKGDKQIEAQINLEISQASKIDFEKNHEAKIFHYLTLKKLLEQGKVSKK